MVGVLFCGWGVVLVCLVVLGVGEKVEMYYMHTGCSLRDSAVLKRSMHGVWRFLGSRTGLMMGIVILIIRLPLTSYSVLTRQACT